VTYSELAVTVILLLLAPFFFCRGRKTCATFVMWCWSLHLQVDEFVWCRSRENLRGEMSMLALICTRM
jgi:hypothetical protein